MNRSMTIKWIAVLAVVALWAPASMAQINTAVIEVSTVDQDDLALPGVAVEATNLDTGLARSSVTNASGEARLAALPPGTYDVTAALDGFAPAGQEALAVIVGQTARLRFTLRPQTSDIITVTAAQPVVDIFRLDTSTNIVPEQIEELPVPDRDFEKLAFIAPGVQRERGGFRFIQNSPVVGSVGNASQSSILVDGVEFTDQALGLARSRVAQDAIREFRVINSRFDSEIGGSAASAISVITKSGANKIFGSAYLFYRDDALRTQGALEDEKSEFSRAQGGATVGGAIVPDKTHYFASLQYTDTDDIAPFRPGGAFAGQAEDFPLPSKQLLGVLNFDQQFTPASTGALKLVYEQFRQENFRVGGVGGESWGQELNRDNWNALLSHTFAFADGRRLNEARFQFGQREYDEPTNSNDLEEWFSGGNTLKIGTNTVGNLLGDGDYFELRDTFHWSLDSKKGTHDLKTGFALFHVKERSDIPVFQNGTLLYAFDNRFLPTAYLYGIGSADVTVDTDIYSLFIQDDWRVRENVTLSLGLRYDYDTDGNNPDFRNSLTGPRSVDSDNIQPRIGFSWDLSHDGSQVLRGGAGIFTGRYLLVPSFTELQQNGESGLILGTNLNGLLLGLPPAFWLDPTNPQNTGIPLPPDVSLLADSLEAPEAVQLSLGFSQRLGDTGLIADIEAIYAEGDNEITIRNTNFGGNDNPVRLNPAYNQINTYTNDGHSEYTAIVLGLNGTLKGGHLITSSVTFGNKKNLSDDFSPVFPTGYPDDPANIEGEWGRSRGDERIRVVISGVFRLPYKIALAPIWQYGTGQPWNPILGFDYNGDGKNSDRAAGVARNSMDGPSFNSFALRFTKVFTFGDKQIDLIAEGFNIFNSTNYDVTSVDNAEFLSGPSIANPVLPLIPNTGYGEYRATLPPRVIQLGAKFRF